MISKQPGYAMTLQVYFNCSHPLVSIFCTQSLIGIPDNASVTFGETEIKPTPNLWLAVFDPASELEQALDSGYSPLNPIDANGKSSINLDLKLRQPLDQAQITYYSA